MADAVINAIIEDGPLKGRRVNIRYGDSQMDGHWTAITVELQGRKIPFRLAMSILNSPEI